MAWCLAMSPAEAVGRSVPWDAGRSAGVQSWQDYAVVRSRALAGGKISPWCIPERSPMTEMCSPASDSGKISPRCVFGRRSVAAFSLHAFPKGPRKGKAPVRGNISPPCIQNELALARYARRASEKPRKQSSRNTPREDLARKGPFSLRAPLRSCTARRSCHAPTTPNSAGASGGRDMPQLQWHPWRSFPADAPRPAAFPATQANIETRRALTVVYRAETARHQLFVNSESATILEHDDARLKAAIPPEPRQHVHRFAVHAPHFAIFRPVVHACILEQVFV